MNQKIVEQEFKIIYVSRSSSHPQNLFDFKVYNQIMETATLAGGCFWCTEAIFKRLKVIQSVTSGYSGGTIENPTYEQVSTGTTGHAEAIQIQFDPKFIPYAKILDVFWHTHNPTTLN